jgi:hypothetical protein
MARPRTLICGVGINDAPYITQPSVTKPDGTKGRLMCPYYKVWTHMLQRVYSEKEHERNPHTVGTSLCSEWIFFTKFKTWMEGQAWEGCQLDKDILTQRNKHYSSTTCAFVPQYLNGLFVSQDAWRKEYPFGVSKRPEGKEYSRNWAKPYSSRCCIGNNQDYKSLGYFLTPEKAHKAWQEKKIEQIEFTLAKYKLESCYRQDVEDALKSRVSQLRYEIINDLETTFL